ncbi:MAG: trp operon repressor, partial [Vibrio sp.]
MVPQPYYTQWQQVLDLVKQAVQQDQHELLLT